MTGHSLTNQIQAQTLGCADPDPMDPTMCISLQPRGQADQVDFVKDLDTRDFGRTDLLEDLMNRRLIDQLLLLLL